MKIITILIVFFSTGINACPSRTDPSHDFDKYETIFIGTVTGIQLKEHQKMMIEGLRDDPKFRYWADSTQEYEVTVLPQRLKKGHVNEVEVLKISGCGVIEPKPRQVGIFFIQPDGLVRVLYSQQDYRYADFIEEVGIYSKKLNQNLEIKRVKKTSK